MKIKSLRVQNFRAHEDILINLSEGSTLISGANGSGKTSLLEAIYLALRGTSFRSSDKEIVKRDGKFNWFRIDLTSVDGEKRIVKFDSDKANGKKQFEIDGKKSLRLTNLAKIPVILFEPTDLQLLSGSPARRRNFLDSFLAQIHPSFGLTLRKYDKALKQRNNLLKRDDFSDDEIFPWNLMLAEYGTEIINMRLEFVADLNAKISSVYKNISGVDDEIILKYDGEKMSKDRLLRSYNDNLAKDRLLGFTNFGPHRHDLKFYFNGAEADSVASRGENRSIVLALKFLETDILAKLTDKEPIILLDDVFSELDESRQNLLTEFFSRYQTIISSVDKIDKVNLEISL